MKILIVSDSHGDWHTLQRLVEREKPDRVLHLGDLLGDAQKLSLVCPEISVEAVWGNCDGWVARGETERVLTYEGVRFFMTHGHGYQVKSTQAFVLRAGRQAGADVILFGHTHQAVLEQQDDGVWLVNPGTAGGVHADATYALAWAEAGTVQLELKTVD